ncbi:MAG: hypothetical protein M1825_000080 [Sarcosagium campestre]|nr:MAG: hypothetical protein M1825_000080 [Sarcosagium campestre]
MPHVWRVFACAFPPEVPETVHPWQDYRKYIPISAITTLYEFIGPVTSLDCRWITVLSLPALLSSRTELASLSDMTNLGALHISPTLAETCDRPDGDFVLDDSILRAWSRAAVQNGGFKSLRFLALINHRSITLQGLKYLEAIPTLMICDLTGSAIRTADALAATSKSSDWELIRCDPTEKSPPAEAPSQVMQTLSAEYHMAASRLPSFQRRGNVGSSVLTLLIGTAGDGRRRRLKNRLFFRRVCLRLEDPAASSSSTPAQGKRKTSVSSGSCPAKRNKRCDFEKETAAEGEEQAEKAEREEEEEEEDSIPKQPSVGKRDDKQKKKQKKKRRRSNDAALDDGKTRNLTDMLADFAAA